MPKLQRFEGIDPAEVRARIRNELGPDATIVRAGRERSGGLLGFFEREVFVIEAEAPDGAAPAERERTPRSKVQRARGAEPAPAPAPAMAAAVVAPPSPASAAAPMPATSGAAVPAGGLEGAVEATADVVSIRGERFDDSFSHVLKEAEATLAAGQEEAPRHFTPRLVTSSYGAAAAAPAEAPTVGEPPSAPPSLAPEYERVLREAGIHLEVATVPSDTELDLRSRPPARAARVAFAAVAASPAAEALDHTRVAPAPAAAPEDEQPDTLARIRLSRLGLPAVLQPDATVEPLEMALLASLAGLPPAPALPQEEDAVLLALGGEGTASKLALLLAERIGADEEAVVTISAPGVALNRQPKGGRRVTSALRAATAVAERRIAGEATVLAYELAEGSATAALLADVVAATRPDATWAAVPATFEPLALRQIERVARRIDALALYDLDDADRPAYLLGVGTPIALLDWRDASPLMWAARLAERAVGGA